MKLTKDLLHEGQYDKTLKLVEQCHEVLKINGQDDTSKGSQLLEIYAVKMEVATAQMERGSEDARLRLQKIFEKTEQLTADVSDPKVMSIIKECFGKMYGSSGKWVKAFE